MRRFTLNLFAVVCGMTFALAFFLVCPSAALAQKNWKATVGGQSKDMGRQAEAFLPNEFWIHAGDKITWTFDSGDTHTVTFLLLFQPFPLSFTGVCPAPPASGAVFDGTTACVSSLPSTTGQSFAVTFSTPGNYELVCLVHPEMFGTIHVLANSEILPHDQAFYDEQAEDERSALLDDIDPPTSKSHHSMTGMLSASVIARTRGVIAGFGEIAATAGGQESLSVVRFIDGTVEIHAGDTVEWSNLDPIIAHTITFGTEPADLFDPSCGPSPGCVVSIDPDGALHATITGPGQNVHSGFILAALEGYTGGLPVPQLPLFPPTRFRLTFTQAGSYNYKCSLHDSLGMVGKVIVLP
jgi:plastocyanin